MSDVVDQHGAPHLSDAAPSGPAVDLPAPVGTSEPAPVLPGPTESAPPLPTAPAPVLSAPGAAPILSSADAPMLPTLPAAGSAPRPASPPAAVEEPVAPAPQLATGVDLPTLPTLPSTAPVTPAATAAVADDSDRAAPPVTAATDAGTAHPPADEMPKAAGPSESSKWAAELRAAKKAKARKVKIGVAIGALVFCAVVGPPLGKWLVDAINDAGSTTTEETG